MGEDIAWACEASRWQRRGMFRGLGLFQRLHEDALHAPDVDEVHLQGLSAGGVQTLGSVALSQPDELVALPHLGPRERPVEQALSEFGHRRTLLGGAALDAVGSPEGVGAQLGGVVGSVGGAAAPRLAGVDLDQLASVVDADQLQAQADLHLLPRRAQGGGHRVEGVLAGHVVVGVNFCGAPVGDFVGLAVPGEQGLAFLVQEDLQGLTTGGAVDAQSGDIATPAGRFISQVGQVPELAALEEALPGVLDAPFHFCFVPVGGAPGPGR